VLEAIRCTAGEVAADLEVTVECNPSSLDRAQAERLRDVGVDRLSIGVQSLDAERLAFLGRLHDPEQAMAAVRAAVEVMPRVSADLMFGVAGDRGAPQRPDQAAGEARRVSELGVRHLSAYALTIEPNTRFGELSRQGRLPLVEEAEVADSFLAVGEALAMRGFEHYEISNYARTGERSRHNLGYWRGHDYLGLGAAAFGALATQAGHALRYRNPPKPERYFAMIARGALEPHETDALDPDTRLRERLMLGLRLSEGLDLEQAAAELGVDPWPSTRRRRADDLVSRGRLIVEAGRLRIPPDAWLFTDGTAAALF
jgi:oxygen-independent coproporphyrinogen-3 oxidase